MTINSVIGGIMERSTRFDPPSRTAVGRRSTVTRVDEGVGSYGGRQRTSGWIAPTRCLLQTVTQMHRL